MRRFTVAIGGTSFGRSVQAVAFQRHPGFELVALAGSDPGRTRRIADELGVAGAYTDWARMLHELEPVLASVASPVDLHHPMTMSALERGSHVLCEKPTALNRFQAAEMRDRALELGRVGAVNHEFRFFPARRHALDLVRRGAIGVPRRGDVSRQRRADDVGKRIEPADLKVSFAVGRRRAAVRCTAIAADAHRSVRKRLPILIDNAARDCSL